MKKVVIYGNGSVAEVAHFLLTHDSLYEVAGFTVDRGFIKEKTLFELPVVPFDNVTNYYPPDEYKMFIAVGYVRVNRIRAERYYQAKKLGYQLISYISSKALTWPGLVIGDNCKIAANSIIQPFAKLGNNVRIASSANVGHHTIINDHCSLATNVTIAGNVTIESYCVIGANVTIRDRITIAKGCVLGAGAVILEDTKENEVYLGRPAELLPISSKDLPLS